MEHTSELKVGNTVFIVTEEFSQTATETVEQKLKKLINAHIYDSRRAIGKLSEQSDNQLAMCLQQSEYGQYQTRTRGIPNEEETS
jgi:hypothetical protein